MPRRVTKALAYIAGIVALAAVAFNWVTVTTVAGESMEPTYWTGDVVIATTDADPEIGDVIIYEPTAEMNAPYAHVIHRIVEVTDDGFVTRGDNNDHNDPEVPAENVLGVARVHIPKIGGILRTPAVAGSIAGLCALLIFWPSAPKADDDDADADNAEATAEAANT